MMQVFHQKMQFSPKGIFAFDITLMIHAITFEINFATIFLQFYLY
jgi:hypothetical protein